MSSNPSFCGTTKIAQKSNSDGLRAARPLLKKGGRKVNKVHSLGMKRKKGKRRNSSLTKLYLRSKRNTTGGKQCGLSTQRGKRERGRD